MDVRLPDGTIIKGVPDGMSKADLTAKLQANGYDVAKLNAQPAPEKSTLENIGQGLANIGGGAIQGAANIGDTLLSVSGLSQRPRGERMQLIKDFMQQHGIETDSTGYKGGEVGAEIAGTAGVGGAIAKPIMAAAKYAPQLARVGQAVESAGFNVGAPAETLAGKAANAALRVGGGATTGAAAAGMINPDDVGTGAVAGGAFGALSPIAAKAISAGVRKFTAPNAAESAQIAQGVDNSISQVANDLGVEVKDLPRETVDFIRAESAKALEQGKTIDAAALLRKQDFEKLGMQPLQGQITRDPTQYAQELNLRGASPEIAGRLNEQNRTLQGVFGKPAQGATEQYEAGNQLSDALRGYDVAKRGEVSSLYGEARKSAGKDLELPMQGLAQEFGDITSRYSQNVLNSLPLEQFKQYGVMGGKQTKLYTVEEADKLMKVINSNTSNDPAVNAALGELRNAVRGSVEAVDASGGVFAPAVKAAKQRFTELDAIPALKAVAQGKVEPDTFVKKYVVQGKTDDVKRLAELLRNQSPESFSQAKSQVADDIKRAAFGENPVGDSAVSPERLAKKLRELGREKMNAFFTPDEIDNYQTASRVAAYIAKHPNAAPVNTSNTLVAQLMANPALNMAANIKGLGVVAGAAKAATGAVKNQMAATQAMKANVPMEKMQLTESQRKLLGKAIGAVGAGVTSQFAQ